MYVYVLDLFIGLRLTLHRMERIDLRGSVSSASFVETEKSTGRRDYR